MAGEETASTPAPSAGPATIAAWPIAARAAFARCRRSASTSRGVDAATAGGCTLATSVAAPASSGASTTGSPNATTPASATISAARTRSDAMISRRRS